MKLYRITRLDRSERNAHTETYLNGLTFEQAAIRVLALHANAKIWLVYDIEEEL